MKKQSLVLLFLCFQMIAQAQTTYRYWFDTDDNSAQEGTSSGKSLKLDIDVSDLTETLHQLHVQVTDKDGIQSAPITKWFVRTPTRTSHGVYWFDDNVSDLHRSDVLKGRFDIDVSDLTDGVHILNYQLRDKKDRPSSLLRTFFLKMPVPAKTKVHYWIDNDTENMQTLVYNGNTHILDLAKVEDGLHVLNIQADDTSPSAVLSKFFIKIPQTKGVDKMTCICTIDGETVKQGEVTNHDGILNWIVDVNNLSHGVHQIQVQVVTGTGAATSVYKGYFMRELTSSETASLKCLYTVDDNAHKLMAGNLGNGVFHFDLDVAEYSDGLHKLTYMLIGENGVISKTNNAFFWKTPLGGNGVVQYSYWLNDQTEKHVVKLPKRTNPFEFISLVPVDNLPVRSSCFDFKVENGQPMMYAKNDIHFEFVDAAGFVSLVNAQYVDPRAKEAVTDLSVLKETQTFARLNDNDIKWFKFEAEYGDSIAIKSSQATTLQIFDSAGKQLYNTNGNGSVEYGGCHLFEDDTYYLAVHDVKGSEQSMIVDCKRINKFDVFEFTPTRMSSMGSTTIDIKGNGLEFAKSVSLTNGDITLHPDTLVANSSELLARFALTEDYDVTKDFDLNVFFHNVERNESKNLCMKNSIHLEPMNRGDISVNIVTEHRVGDPFPVKVTVKNNGNVGYYGIPFNIAYDNIRKIDELVFVNFGMQISQDAYTKNDFWAVTDNIVGTGVEGLYLPTYLPYLGPYEEYTYVFGLKTKHAHTRLNFYAWTGEPWYDGVSIGNASANNAEMKAKGTRCVPSNITDVYDALDAIDAAADLARAPLVGNAATAATNGMLIGEAIGGTIQGMSAMQNNAMAEAGYAPMGYDINDFAFQYRYCPRSPRDILETFLNSNNPVHSKGTAIPNVTASSRRSIKDYASGDCPKPNPHPTDVWIPGDPNEMTGYVSEAGSTFLMDTVQVVSYDIEFENDPEIANSSAHVITIENKLDAYKFDLSSFTPKDITLSGRRVELDGSPSFVKTIDLRPQIDAIAELRCDYNSKEGLAKWTLTSLDPMTMEQTDDIMQGILPVNYDGKSGIGNVTYSVKLKQKFADGTEIPNKASIIFDNNDPIMTPTWTNIIDAVAPVSKATDVALKNDTTAIIRFEGSDERSGVWKYEVYAQQGIDAPWIKIAEVPADSSFVEYRIYDDIDYGYCTLSVDSAGNVEDKVLRREVGAVTYILGDADGDGAVTKADVELVVDYFLGRKTKYINEKAADVNGDGKITIADANAIVNICIGGK